jgi:hypothetical protein
MGLEFFQTEKDTGPAGEYTVKKLPPGNYKLRLEHPGC